MAAYGQNPFQMGYAGDNRARVAGMSGMGQTGAGGADPTAALMAMLSASGGGMGAPAPAGAMIPGGRAPMMAASATPAPATPNRSGSSMAAAAPIGPQLPNKPQDQWTQDDWQQYSKNQQYWYMDWLSKQKGGLPKNAVLSQFLGDFGAKGFTGLMPFAGISSNLGGATLAQLLASQGATDPRLMNQQLAGIDRGTQTQQQGVQGELARRGLGASGIGQALSASVGQAGEGRKADLRANEAQLQEQRKRDDLGLLMQMILQPGTDASAMHLGQYNTSAARGDNKKGAQLAALASIFAAFACWAAEEVFHNPQDEDAVRLYMATHPDLAYAYLISGKDLAYEIKHNEAVRRVIVPRFHEFAEVGYGYPA